jgi:spermidine/putrescine transport system substrate-binding protein
MTRLTAAVAMLLATTGLASAEGELNLYNWGNYTNPALLEKFKAETGITVTVTDYDSNDTALAKVEAGGHGFDLVVPSANFVPIWVEKGLTQPLDLSRPPNHGNIAPEWMDVSWDPGRQNSIPWQWGTTGISVNKSVYSGDINTSAIFLDPPEELVGRVNVIPEMNDIISMATMYVGGEVCSEDPEVLRQVRDLLMAAKPKWVAMDYGTVERMGNNDWAATVTWNGASKRSRQVNPDVTWGYPKEGYPIFMDSVMLLSDAQNVEEAYAFMNFIMVPENAAMISDFARYSPAITGSDAFLPEDMKTAPELVPPAEFANLGVFLPVCSEKAQEFNTAIWTELMR